MQGSFVALIMDASTPGKPTTLLPLHTQCCSQGLSTTRGHTPFIGVGVLQAQETPNVHGSTSPLCTVKKASYGEKMCNCPPVIIFFPALYTAADPPLHPRTAPLKKTERMPLVLPDECRRGWEWGCSGRRSWGWGLGSAGKAS